MKDESSTTPDFGAKGSTNQNISELDRARAHSLYYRRPPEVQSRDSKRRLVWTVTTLRAGARPSGESSGNTGMPPAKLSKPSFLWAVGCWLCVAMVVGKPSLTPAEPAN